MATYITTGPDGNIKYEIEPGAPVEMLKNIQPGSAGPGGQPVPVTSADQMTDESTIYLYMGDEEGYTSGHWYYYDATDEEWKDGGEYPYNPIIIDDTLTQEGEAADAKATGDAIKAITPVEAITMISGAYIALSGATADITSPTAAAAYSYTIVNCSAGDVFTINATGGGAPRAYGFIDGSGNVLDRSYPSVTLSDYLVFAPEDATQLIINDNSGSTSYKGATTETLANFISTIKSFTAPIVLTSSNNLNNILTAGLYFVANSFPTNYPQGHAETQKMSGFIKVDRQYVSGIYDLTTQTVIDYRNKIFVRRRNASGQWSSWSEFATWQELSSINTTLSTQITTATGTVPDYPVKIFQRVGCIGDSYTEGYINQGGVVTIAKNYSWPHFMEKITGNIWTNFGVSGSSAKEWIEGGAYSGLDDVETAGNKCQAYVIGLGINDSNSSAHGYTPVGTSADIGTDAQTYYAYMYKLISAVLEVNALAPVFICTCPLGEERLAPYNTAVRDIVTYCSTEDSSPVFLLDLAGSRYNNAMYFQKTEFLADFINGHYTAIGYEFMAECLLRVISDVMSENISYFQGVHKIPFDAPT